MCRCCIRVEGVYSCVGGVLWRFHIRYVCFVPCLSTMAPSTLHSPAAPLHISNVVLHLRTGVYLHPPIQWFVINTKKKSTLALSAAQHLFMLSLQCRKACISQDPKIPSPYNGVDRSATPTIIDIVETRCQERRSSACQPTISAMAMQFRG